MIKLSAVAQGAVLGTALSLATLFAPPAHAVIGVVDRVPAATLLLPYFEVNLGDPNGTQTRFSVINTSATPQMAHATLWTDMGVPSFSFDLYLGGRDTVEVDLRLLFSGVVPQTSPTAFNAGPYSSAHAPVAGCPLAGTALYAGMPAAPLLASAQTDHLRAAHSGKSSTFFGGMCSAANHSDNVARGYVTVDAVNSCSSGFPTDANYFANAGAGIASNNNVLIGQYTLIDRADHVATVNPLVSVEASSTDPLTSDPTQSTFYGGYVGGSARDNREILNNVWRARHLDAGFFDAGSEMVVWRDPVTPHAPFACGTTPQDFPRTQSQVVSFDEEENIHVLNNDVFYPNPQPPPVYPFPLITQRVRTEDFSPFLSGVEHLNFNGPLTGSSAGTVQSFVAVRHAFNGVFGAMLPAEALNNADNSNNIGGF